MSKSSQTIEARVERIRWFSEDTGEVSLTLVDPSEMVFEAGQFISFEVGEKLVRPYSMANPPSQKNRLDFAFKLLPSGPGSDYIRSFTIGMPLLIKGPSGAFTLKWAVGQGDFIFVAAGVGIGPIRSIILHLIEQGVSGKMWLYFGARYRHGLVYAEEFFKLASQNERFIFKPALTRPEADWTGLTGRVTEHLDAEFPFMGNEDVYICGGKPMVQDVRNLFLERGYSRKQVHWEKFF